MKKNIKNFLVKAFSMCLAFILVFPTNLFAIGLDNTETKKYSATASIMGLAQNDTTSQTGDGATDQTLLETEITSQETDKYLIEKYARLSKTTGQIEYKIKVFAKDKTADDKLTASFAISENTDLEDLKIEKISQLHSDNSQSEIKHQEQRPSILYTNDAFETLGVTTEKADLVYYLSAKLKDQALANIDDQTPNMDLDINIAETGANVYQGRYALTIEDTDLVDENGQVSTPLKLLKEKSSNQAKAKYNEATSTSLGEITWTDFIHADDDEEFTYEINLDDSQEPSQIKIEFYKASEQGYVLEEDFTNEIPFAPSLNLQIPQGYIAKIELTTKVTENQQTFTYNDKEISNPAYNAEEDSAIIEDAGSEEDQLEISDIDQSPQRAVRDQGSFQTAYQYSVSYGATATARYQNGSEITSTIPDFSKKPEIWWDIQVDTSKISKNTNLAYNNLYYTLYMGAKDGLDNFKYKASTSPIAENDNSGFRNASTNAVYLYEGFGNIAKNKLTDTLYIRVKAPLDKNTEVHDQYSLGIRINPDNNYVDNLRKEFLAKYNSIPTPFKWKFGDGQAEIYKDRPFDLLDERIVASPNFTKYDIDDNFYFDTTRSITSDRISDTRVEWNILDLLRIGESEDPNIGAATLNPEETEKNTYYYRPNRNGGYSRVNNPIDVKTENGDFYPGTIVAYNYEQKGELNTSYNLDVTLSAKEYQFKTQLDNQMIGNTQLSVPVGGWVGAYTYRVPQAEIDDQYLAYNENPFAIMRINQTFEMVQCFNDGNKDPTSKGNNKIGLQRIEDPDAAFLWSMMQGNNADYAKENLEPGGKYNKQNAKSDYALKDALKRAYYYTNQVIEENEKDGKKIPRQVEAFLYQKMVHLITNNKPIDEQYGVDTSIPDTITNWTNKSITLTGDEKDKYFTGETSGANRQIPNDERRLTSDNKALVEAEELANKAKELLENSYTANGDWNDAKADSVDLVFYKHNDTRTLQNLITAKVRKPIQAQKITVNNEPIAGVEFTFTNRLTGESVKWTSKEDNKDNPLYLKPGQYYVDEIKYPDRYSKLETFLIELKEEEVNPDNGPYPQYGLNIHVNDGYKYKLLILNQNTRAEDPNAVQKDGSGNPLVTVDKDKLKLNIKNEDSNLGSIEFDKTNGKRNLDGATFTLTKITDENNLESVEMVDGKPIYKKTSTGNNGKFSFGSMPEGTYKLEETKAPEGYQAIDPLILIAKKNQDGKIIVKFKDENIEQSKEIINKAPSTELSFRKVKNDGGKLVPIDSGTGKFRLYSIWTSDETDYDRTVSPSATEVKEDKEKGISSLQVGEFKFTDLVEGEYILVEEQAPTGFQKPDNASWRVKVMEDDKNPGKLIYEVYKIVKDGEEPKIKESDILDENGQTIGKTFNIENKPRTIDHKFKKYKENDGILPGEKYTLINNLVGADGNPVSFRLYEADYYGLKKNPNDKGILITPNNSGEFELNGLKFSTYYLLEEETPPAGYTKAAPTVLYVEAEAEAQTGQMKVVVRDRTSNTISDSNNIFTGIVDYETGKKYGNLVVKKTGKSLIENDDSVVGLRRAYFRLYYADDEFDYADENFKKVESQDKASYVERVSAGRALTDDKGNPLPLENLPGDQGIAKFENLKPGNYILIEHRGPAGYEKDPEPRYVIVDENGNVTLSEEKNGTFERQENEKPYEIFNVDETGFRIPLRITKKGENGSPLSGAQFKARKIIEGEDKEAKYFDEEFDAVSEATGLTGDNYFRELSPGIYELTETRSPRPKGVEGEEDSEYILPNQKWYFKVKRNPDQDNPRKSDYMIIDFKFSHTFSEDDDFTIAGQDYNSEDWYGKTIYGTEPVNENGKIVNEEFMKLIKLVPDDGRSNPARPDAPYKKIDDLEVTNVKKTTEFDFIKADDYSRAIEGADFRLRKLATDDNGNIKKALIGGKYEFDETFKEQIATSNTNEGVIFKDIPAGTYLLEETKAPAGYEKLEKPIIIKFEISPTTGRWVQTRVVDEEKGITNDYYNSIISDKSDNTGISQIKNKKAYTKLEFTKVDQNGDEIRLSAFRLEKIDKDGNLDNSFTPQEIRNWNNANFSFENLTAGKYKLTETNPTKYQQPNPTYFDVVTIEQTGKLEIKFEKGDPNIKIVDKDNGKETQFINFKKIDFEFAKIGYDKKPLYGAGFSLKKVLTEKPRVVDGQEIDHSKQIKYTEKGEVAKGYEELSDYSYYEKARSYSDGKIKFTGLSQGVYELEETNIPSGYQRLNAQRKWIIYVEKNEAGNGLEVKYDYNYEKEYYQNYDGDYFNKYYKDQKRDSNVLNIDGKDKTLTNTSNTTDLNFNKVDRMGELIKKDTRFTLIKLSHNPNDLDNLSNIDTYVDYISLGEEEGTFTVKGLDRGLYILEETKAPQGYKPAKRAIVLQLIEGEDGKLVINSYEAEMSKDNEGKVTYTLVTDNFKYLDNKNDPIDISNDEIPNIAFNKVTNSVFDHKNIEEGTLEIAISKYDATTGQVGDLVETLTFDLAETKSLNNIYIEDLDEKKILDNGQYLIKETKAPDGYKKTDRSYLVDISTGDGGEVTVKLLEVQDASGQPIKDDEGKMFTDTGIEIPKGGLVITETKGDSNFKIVNNNPSLPITGGTGTKIAFALIGTAVMITAIAYFGMLTSNKNRRRSRR